MEKLDLVADIEQAFLQISINKKHRDLVRLLWYEDIYKENPELVTLQFCRVVFGLTCSPFLLNGTISAHLEQFNGYVNLKEFICKFIRDLYVDDSSSSCNHIEDAYSFYKRTKPILNLAQFDLRKWETNDIKLKKQLQISESLDSNDTVPSTADLQLTTRKALGVNWDTKTNKFVFDFQEIATNALNLTPTKRNILKIVTHLSIRWEYYHLLFYKQNLF